MRPRTLLQALGLAAFALFRLYAVAIAHPSDLRMHSPLPLTDFALSLIVNLVLAGLVLALLATWIARSDRLRWLRVLLPGTVAVLLAKVTATSLNARIRPSVEMAIFLSLTIAAVLLRRRWRRAEEILSQWTGAALVGMGIFSLFVILQLAGIAAWRPAPNAVDNLPAATSVSADRPRVVWILFDELSYSQTFGNRYPGLQLPNFDKLRETSTVFTHVLPVENYTELAIPSILLGFPVVRVRYTFHNKFEVATSRKSKWRNFDAALTPFAQAQQNGLTTGVVGWYNPYCGMLAPYLDQCYWFSTNAEDIPQNYDIHAGFWRDLWTPWARFLQDGFHPRKKNWVVTRHMETYKDLLQHSDEALKEPGLDFVFIHLSLPHPPGFYNRETRRFDETGKRSYVDNLALTDRTLGQMLAILRKSPRWKNTTVVLCGDHSWRTWLWSKKPGWTREDQAASHGSFDPRPALMIHLAGQTAPETVSAPFPLLRVHSILTRLVTGQTPSFMNLEVRQSEPVTTR